MAPKHTLDDGVALKRSATPMTSEAITKKKNGVAIDEALDQPGSGDTVYV